MLGSQLFLNGSDKSVREIVLRFYMVQIVSSKAKNNTISLKTGVFIKVSEKRHVHFLVLNISTRKSFV